MKQPKGTKLSPNQLSVAYSAGWVCAHCARPCKLPQQSPDKFLAELGDRVSDIMHHPRRYTMHVVHLNRNKQDESLINLKPLCLPCAMRFYALFRRRPIHRRRRFV